MEKEEGIVEEEQREGPGGGEGVGGLGGEEGVLPSTVLRRPNTPHPVPRPVRPVKGDCPSISLQSCAWVHAIGYQPGRVEQHAPASRE